MISIKLIQTFNALLVFFMITGCVTTSMQKERYLDKDKGEGDLIISFSNCMITIGWIGELFSMVANIWGY